MWFLVALVLAGYLGGLLYLIKVTRDAARLVWTLVTTKRAREVTNDANARPTGRRSAAGNPDAGTHRIAEPSAYGYADAIADNVPDDGPDQHPASGPDRNTAAVAR